MKSNRSSSRGFTLVEVLLAAVVLSIAVGAITQSISTGHKQTADALHSLRASSLVEALMEEILALPYADPNGVSIGGAEEGETSRAAFDNMDDFDGYSESVGQVKTMAAAAYPSDYADFGRSVTVTYGSVTISALGGTISGVTVVVTVTNSKGRRWSMTRFVPEPLQ